MRGEREVIEAAYAAFNRRDLDEILVLLHPDVDWPNGMEGGRVHGRDAVRDYWTRQWKLLDPHVEPVGINTEQPGETTVDVHQVVRDLSGRVIVDQMIQHVYAIRDGLIERMEIRNL